MSSVPALTNHSRTIAGYQPAWRRPIAGAFRATAAGTVRLSVRHGVHPDVISCLSVVVSALAGLCFWRAGDWVWLLVAAPLLCYARLWLNMLDGMVALASGKASPRGEIFNELPDRLSDLVIFAGVAHSGLASPYIAYWAAMLALLTAYVGTLGQAVGAQREFGGVMSKPWRMVVLHAGAWTAAALIVIRPELASSGTLTVLDWTCLVIVFGCVQTIAVRLRRIFRALETIQGR